MEPLSALLVSDDARVISVASKIFDEYGFEVSAVSTTRAATELIRSGSYDLGIYDNDIPGVFELTGKKPGSNPRVIFAMVRRPIENNIAGRRVHFIVQKPFNADFFLRSLKAAYGVMLREKRAAFRQEVSIPASSAKLAEGDKQKSLSSVSIVNLSKTGLGMMAGRMLPLGATMQLSFPMPETNESMNVSGTVIWACDNGRAGIRFNHIPASEQKKLNDWIESKLPIETEFAPRQALRTMDFRASQNYAEVR
ncbi:MAG TPA: PilZ domain-containing protein [Candidatus Angelobacter sp.]|nr:PilZ domain-containing protein [Candidatus Angelobacter sp.]